MPLFDWKCYVCGLTYKDLPEPPKKCQGCLRSRFWKVPSAPAIRFKGAGWQTPTQKKEE
jgi:predicted nucleic acid-binding Zn ribbon protein